MNKRGRHLRNHGGFRDGNWPEYRHGPKGPPPKQRPIFKADKRRALVDRTSMLLDRWKETPFEHEATIRHGLRQALCMDGYGWARSDAEAASILDEVFQKIGAVRPSYEQGQWEYTISPDYCAACHGPLDDEVRAKGRRFCSADCAKAVYESRGYMLSRKTYAVARQAYIIIRTAEAPVVECLHCKKPFQRLHIDWERKNGGAKYCSTVCSGAAKRIYAERDCAECGRGFLPSTETQYLCSMACVRKNAFKGPNRTCESCDTPFRYYRSASRPDGGRFCSPRCYHAGGRRAETKGECAWCGNEFAAKSSKAKCCSSYCAQRIVDLRAGKPKTINVAVFDYLLRQQGVRLTSPRITDALFAEAA